MLGERPPNNTETSHLQPLPVLPLRSSTTPSGHVTLRDLQGRALPSTALGEHVTEHMANRSSPFHSSYEGGNLELRMLASHHTCNSGKEAQGNKLSLEMKRAWLCGECRSKPGTLGGCGQCLSFRSPITPHTLSSCRSHSPVFASASMTWFSVICS